MLREFFIHWRIVYSTLMEKTHKLASTKLIWQQLVSTKLIWQQTFLVSPTKHFWFKVLGNIFSLKNYALPTENAKSKIYRWDLNSGHVQCSDLILCHLNNGHPKMSAIQILSLLKIIRKWRHVNLGHFWPPSPFVTLKRLFYLHLLT